MTVPRGEDETAWIGRASPPPPRDPWPTAEQPVVPPDVPPVVYVRVPRRRWTLVVGLLLLSFAAGAVVAMATSPSLRQRMGMGPDGEPPATTTMAPSPTPTTPPPPGIGDPVRDGTFEFVVSHVSCGLDRVEWGLLHETAKGQYCLVAVSVRNTGRLPAALLPRAQHLHTSAGSRHSADATAGYLANRNIPIWDDLVLPGRTVTGTLVFDIPRDAAPAAIELHDSPFSDGTLVAIAPAGLRSSTEDEGGDG